MNEKACTKLNLALVLLYILLTLTNEYLLFKYFPYTGLGGIMVIWVFPLLFLLFLIGFAFVFPRKRLWLGLLYFILATGFIIVWSWRTFPSDIGKYPYLEIKARFQQLIN